MNTYDVHFESMKKIFANSEEEVEDIMQREFNIMPYEISNIQLTGDAEDEDI